MSAVTTDSSAVPRAEAPDGFALRCAERGWLPDAAIRRGMRALMRQRLREEHA
ncbi:SAM-dependent methyltransferase, partial [Burkholderia sp. Cy-647]|nr:SAM-dependent methyltransferase [Burkholderia sp. Cy-647]